MGHTITSIDEFAKRVARARCRIHALAKNLPDSKARPSKVFNEALNEFPSHSAIQQMIVSCFYASLEQDESRACHLSLSWDHPAAGRTYIAKFDEMITVSSPTTLSKLAHATSEGSSLSMQIVGDELKIDGITYRYTEGLEGNEAWTGIRIFVRGAGVIEYFELKYGVCYSRGRISRVRPFWSIPIVAQFMKHYEDRQFAHAYDQLQGKAASRSAENVSSESMSDETRKQLARAAVISGRKQLQCLLLAIQRKSHGGTLAFAKTTPEFVERRFPPCTSSLRWLINDHLASVSLMNHYIPVPEMYLSTRTLVSNRLIQIEDFFRMTGETSGLDGILVMNHDFEVLEIGAIVPGSDEPIQYRLVDQKGQTLLKQDLLKNRGTRHRAALRFCEMSDDAIVFIVSQDGDLRLFARIGSEILFVDGVSSH